MSARTCHVYLLHFARPLGGRFWHYLGSTTRTVAARADEHRAGRGGHLTRWAVRVGIDFVVARVWSGVAPGLERELKRRGGFRRLCPVCMELGGGGREAAAGRGAVVAPTSRGPKM